MHTAVRGAPRSVPGFIGDLGNDACYRKITGHGVTIATEPGNQPYGMREFAVQDPNGVAIVFDHDFGRS